MYVKEIWISFPDLTSNRSLILIHNSWIYVLKGVSEKSHYQTTAHCEYDMFAEHVELSICCELYAKDTHFTRHATMTGGLLMWLECRTVCVCSRLSLCALCLHFVFRLSAMGCEIAIWSYVHYSRVPAMPAMPAQVGRLWFEQWFLFLCAAAGDDSDDDADDDADGAVCDIASTTTEQSVCWVCIMWRFCVHGPCIKCVGV